MKTRIHFAEELNKFQQSVVEMGTFVVKALEQSVNALVSRNVDLARSIIEHDPDINTSENEIINLSTLLIAEEQPVARDLRIIINAM